MPSFCLWQGEGRRFSFSRIYGKSDLLIENLCKGSYNYKIERTRNCPVRIFEHKGE